MAKGEIVLSNFFFCHYVFKKLSAADASESIYMRERLMHYAPVNCNHGPLRSGGIPGIAGEMGHVFTFQVALQCRVNAVVLFSLGMGLGFVPGNIRSFNGICPCFSQAFPGV